MIHDERYALTDVSPRSRAPKRASYQHERQSMVSVAEFAMRIALAYPHRAPEPNELRERYGMSRATAFRWVRAFKNAKGQA